MKIICNVNIEFKMNYQRFFTHKERSKVATDKKLSRFKLNTD